LVNTPSISEEDAKVDLSQKARTVDVAIQICDFVDAAVQTESAAQALGHFYLFPSFFGPGIISSFCS